MGDIDNRLKTLFDALQTPPEGQMPREALGTSRNNPFRTLLKDDNLVADLLLSYTSQQRGTYAPLRLKVSSCC